MHKYDDFKKVMVELETEGFMVKEHELNGKTVYLITPQHIGCTWTKNNLIYRSSVWDENGDAVSLSWKKFFNFGEAPNVVEDPDNIVGCPIMDKRDGSTLIVSVFNGDWVIRTRGTVDATNLTNGYEIEQLKAKYPAFFNYDVKDEITGMDVSVIFEWETPNNRIVLNNCDEPQLILTGIVFNKYYRYYNQEAVDAMAKMWKLERPARYEFKTLAELLDGIKDATGIEGCCLYFNDWQDIKKIKSTEYLKLHAFKFNMAGSYKPLCEYIVSLGKTTVDEVKEHIIETYDFECWEFIEDKVTKVIDEFNDHLCVITSIYYVVRNIETQKEFAQYVMSKYKDYSGYLFEMRKKGVTIADDLLNDERMSRKFASDLVVMMEKTDDIYSWQC